MNYFMRRVLVGVCIAVVMMGVHKLSRADAPQSRWYVIDNPAGAGTANGVWTSAAAACAGGSSQFFSFMTGGGWVNPPSYFTSGSAVVVGGNMCRFTFTAQYGATNWDFGPANLHTICADGSAPDTSKALADQCNPPCPVAGTPGDSHSYVVGYGPLGAPMATINQVSLGGTIISSGGCGYRLSAASGECSGAPSNGFERFTCDYGSSATGEQSSVAPPADAAPPTAGQGSCGTGQSQIGTHADGTPMCTATSPNAPPNPAPSNSNTATTSNPDGSTTTTTTTTNTNNDGSTTTTTTNVNVGPAAAGGGPGPATSDTSSSTSPIPAGLPGAGGPGTATGGGGGSGSGQKNNDLCFLHPELTICKNSSVSGDCAQLSCEGDAINCSILRTSRQAVCDAQTLSPAGVIGQAALENNDPLSGTLPNPGNGQTVTMPSTLSSATFLSGGCFVDKVVPFANGQTLTLPFSKVCDYLQPFRYAIMFCALMLSFNLVSGVIFRI